MYTEQELIRRAKLEKLAQHVNPYPERFPVNTELDAAAELPDDTPDIRVAGRIVAMRKFGKLTFIKISNVLAQFQLALKQDETGAESYAFFHEYVDIGDFIGVEGHLFTTKTGEKTLAIEQYVFLGKSLKQLPEKWHGLTDVESCYRHRYLDLIMSQETRQRFLLKAGLAREIRRYLEDHGYMEAETPVLQGKPSGALARPFQAHHEALDLDVYLRIAPETYLKRLIVGGFTKVFEFARCFRNEGVSPTHLQDFTMIEGYAAYWSYRDNMAFLQNMVVEAVRKVFGGTVLSIGGREVDLSGEWRTVSFKELILQDIGLDIDQYDCSETLLAAIRAKQVPLDYAELEKVGRGNLIDQLYKKVSRPKLIEPIFLVDHPIELSPLARANDQFPGLTDRFQLVMNGAEIINAYSELVDPGEQKRRLAQQAADHAKGDGEAMVTDDDYITAMEYGMPPISGWGIGLERLLQVLTDSPNIKDCTLFPLMRPLD